MHIGFQSQAICFEISVPSTSNLSTPGCFKVTESSFSDCKHICDDDDDGVTGVEEETKGGVITRLSSLDDVLGFLALRTSSSAS